MKTKQMINVQFGLSFSKLDGYSLRLLVFCHICYLNENNRKKNFTQYVLKQIRNSLFHALLRKYYCLKLLVNCAKMSEITPQKLLYQKIVHLKDVHSMNLNHILFVC